ncbi:MAG: glycosyltransferase family 2 protein [Bifidobacteriaceae bacterium]|jgi:glycosyltransferase involved in cell wall biosynthesis|nr:glycosyltransferase family 2 protein [Bifidobacteriaceae bacterium]
MPDPVAHEEPKEPAGQVLYAVIPAYNEAENIEALVAEWLPVITAAGPDARLVVIDDGSKDDTLELLRDLERRSGEGLVVLSKPNSGHGATLLHGYRYALDHGADFVFQTDSDRQTVPSEFPAFWELRDTAAAVIGWRRGRQDGFSRLIVTKVLKLVVRMVFRVSAPDANCPFRLMAAGPLRQALATIPPGHNLANVLVVVRLIQQGRTIRWIPVTFRPRQGGVNSINIPKIVGIGRRALRDFWTLRRR